MKKFIALLMLTPATAFAHDVGFAHAHSEGLALGLALVVGVAFAWLTRERK